jgi:hypothetical protein
MRLDEKPTRPLHAGNYGITRDGYLIVLERRNTALKGLAMRPSLEYGRLVYRITTNGKTTSIRAFIAVRDTWGGVMHDPGDYKDMCRAIDAHNRLIRDEHKARKKAEVPAPPVPQGLCPFCKKRPMRAHPLAKTCGAASCVRENKRALERDRKRGMRKEPTSRLWDKAYPGPWTHPMRCPWEDGLFDTPPAYGVRWDSAEADPMSAGWGAGGVWVEVRERETERRKAA